MKREAGPAVFFFVPEGGGLVDCNTFCFLPELEKRIPLAAQTTHCAELEELQELLHFPEEVALRLADTEYQLFYQVFFFF